MEGRNETQYDINIYLVITLGKVSKEWLVHIFTHLYIPHVATLNITWKGKIFIIVGKYLSLSVDSSLS